jgi:hypothetical protein
MRAGVSGKEEEVGRREVGKEGKLSKKRQKTYTQTLLVFCKQGFAFI